MGLWRKRTLALSYLLKVGTVFTQAVALRKRKVPSGQCEVSSLSTLLSIQVSEASDPHCLKL